MLENNVHPLIILLINYITLKELLQLLSEPFELQCPFLANRKVALTFLQTS